MQEETAISFHVVGKKPHKCLCPVEEICFLLIWNCLVVEVNPPIVGDKVMQMSSAVLQHILCVCVCVHARARARVHEHFVYSDCNWKSETWVPFLPISITNTGCFHVLQQSFVLDHLIVALMMLNMLHFYMIRCNLSCVGRNHNHWSVEYVPPGHYFTTLLLLLASLMQPWVLRCSHSILIPQASPHVLCLLLWSIRFRNSSLNLQMLLKILWLYRYMHEWRLQHWNWSFDSLMEDFYHICSVLLSGMCPM